MNIATKIKQLEDTSKQYKENIKILSLELSSIETELKELIKENDNLNELSKKGIDCLCGLSFQKAKDVVVFYLEMLKNEKILNFNDSLIDDDNFIYTCIVSLGKDFINKIKKEGIEVETVDNEKLIFLRNTSNSRAKNIGRQLMLKLTKSGVRNYIKKYDISKANK